ncbi:MAG TPA: hypothetical protein VKF14_05325 [Candidatus Dormibacteraeota bacterium]|nr:hypothetical protein [Candidatus Dormibacteraeota bacterium]
MSQAGRHRPAIASTLTQVLGVEAFDHAPEAIELLSVPPEMIAGGATWRQRGMPDVARLRVGIDLQAEVPQAGPEAVRVLVVGKDEQRDPDNTGGGELPARFQHQPPPDSAPAVSGRHNQPVNVPAPPIPGRDHRPYDASSIEGEQEGTRLIAQQSLQSRGCVRGACAGS